MRWLCAAAVALASHAIAQQARYEPFGHGCHGADNATLVTQGLPQIGQTFYVWLRPTTSLSSWMTPQRPGAGIDWLVTGASNKWWKGAPLPAHDQPYLDGCSLLVSLDAIHVAFTTRPVTGFQTTVFSITVPNDPRLVGTQFYQQYVSWSATPGTGGFTVLVSNGGRGTIGR